MVLSNPVNPRARARGPVHIEPKVWGRELWLHNDARYCGKILEIKAGKKTSLHFHKVKFETLHVSRGRVQFTIHEPDGAVVEFVMNPGDMIDIEPGRVHRIHALEDAEVYEFSTQHFDEDTHRIEMGE